jgi:hypothetical protein
VTLNNCINNNNNNNEKINNNNNGKQNSNNNEKMRKEDVQQRDDVSIIKIIEGNIMKCEEIEKRGMKSMTFDDLDDIIVDLLKPLSLDFQILKWIANECTLPQRPLRDNIIPMNLLSKIIEAMSKFTHNIVTYKDVASKRQVT